MGFRDLSFKRKLYFTYSALIVLVLLGFLFTLYVMQRFVFTIDVKALGERVRTGSEQQMAVWFQPPATPKILETKHRRKPVFGFLLLGERLFCKGLRSSENWEIRFQTTFWQKKLFESVN